MLSNQFRYALLLFREDGESVGSAKINVDWDPAVQWTRFYFLRRGELPLDHGCGGISILPRWDRTAGEPYCRGFRVSIGRNGQCPVTSDFATSYFRLLAAQAAAQFVERGELEKGDTFRYLVIAIAAEEAKPESPAMGLQVEEREEPLRVLQSSLADWRDRATPVGLQDPDDLPLFIPQHVLDEIAALTHAERGRETGGILIGNLRHDVEVPEIFAEVTAQVPAAHARGNAVKLTFTPETWSAVDNAIKLRRGSEVYLGYWHSHPVLEWCKSRECTLEKQKNCALAKDFFSSDDEALMRAIFPRAHSIAVVANDTAFTDLTFSSFGWREGFIQPRGYHLLGDDHAT